MKILFKLYKGLFSYNDAIYQHLHNLEGDNIVVLPWNQVYVCHFFELNEGVKYTILNQ